MKQKHLLKNGIELTIVQLSDKQLDEILSLQQKVINSLATESLLQPLTEEEFLYILNGKGILIGAYDNEKLIAFRAMLEPEIDEEHLGKDAGLPRSEWTSVLYSEITNVDPDFQGNNLQAVLGEILMNEITEERFSYICATVAPYNIASLKDKFKLGMQIVALKTKYGNLLRYIFVKNLNQSLDSTHFTATQVLAMENTDDQQQYLEEGWIGTGIEKLDDKWFVRLQK